MTISDNEMHLIILITIIVIDLTIILSFAGIFYWYYHYFEKKHEKVIEELVQKRVEMEESMLECTNAVILQMKFLNRWQKVIAKMIQEDRLALAEHSKKTSDLRDIARAMAKKFLDENYYYDPPSKGSGI